MPQDIPSPHHGMLRICSSTEMRDLDRRAEEEYGIEANILMENAGRAATQILLDTYPHAGKTTEILVFAGKGNNAGDAFVVARRLLCLDRRVRVFHIEQGSRYQGATAKNFEILKKLKAKMLYLDQLQDLEGYLNTSVGQFTIVDGILGTGLKGPVDGFLNDVVELINSLNTGEVISLDIPTGVSGDTGAVHGASIQANLTVSFGFPKLGHFLPPGAGKRGKLVNVDISLPSRFRGEGNQFLLMREPMAKLLAERDRYGHKNSFGHSLLIGGSPGRLGAISMAAAGCHRMGTGLVTVATWSDGFDALMLKLPNETMSLSLSPLETGGAALEGYKNSLTTYSSAVVGPGLGMRPDGKTLLQELMSVYRGPIVLDADALNLISEYRLFDLLVNRRAPTVLTPHPGEMARLLGISKEEVIRDPVRAVREAVKKTHAVVLLKGAATLVCSPDDVLYLSHYPNDGMATAGSGDVLAGMIGGLLGQGMPAFEGTLLAIYLHSLAGDFAAQAFGHRSMTAPDIIGNISHAIQDIKKKKTSPNVPMEARAHLL